MTRDEKKTVIAKIKKLIQASPSRKVGRQYTYVELDGPFLKVTHTAGPKDITFEIIDERLVDMGFPTLDILKDLFEVYKENGNPNDYYYLIVRLKAVTVEAASATETVSERDFVIMLYVPVSTHACDSAASRK